MKYIALYLPQFHEFEQNNRIWGKGFTEWDNVRSAVAYDKTHYQPRIPLDSNYYDLSDISYMEKQAKLAKEYGIYGFCFYHYWFNSEPVMNLPIDGILNNKNVDIPFCISWANHDWNSSAGKDKSKVELKQKYGNEEEWIIHFRYLLKFFKDDRYIKINNKPMMIIHNLEAISCWKDMKRTWDNLARENGLDGLYYVSTLTNQNSSSVAKENGCHAQMEFQPSYTLNSIKCNPLIAFWKIKRLFYRDIIKKPSKYSYDKIWEKVYNRTKKDDSRIVTYLGAFVDWDNTPRWKNRGNYYKGANPKKFGDYLERQTKKALKFHESEYLFINAWNEWGEGAYLEPDEKFGIQYLSEVLRVAENFKE